jgi:hypothetical protein
MHDNGQLDELIRSALDTYADPGPNSGPASELAQRILDRIATEAAPAPRRRWLPWAIALPVAVCLLLLLVLSGPKAFRSPTTDTERVHQPQAPSTNMVNGEPPTAPKSGSSLSAKVPLPKHRPRQVAAAATSARLPRLDVFPTPRPLTPAEQALTDYIAHAPEAERNALIEAQNQIDKPLNIAAIEIRPLEPPEPDKN